MPIDFLADAPLDALTEGMPTSFRAHTTHEQSVVEIPPEATVLARSERDPNHLVRYGKQAYSAQFHPEFNAEVMRAYIRRKHADMQREGSDPRQIFREVAATPVARGLFRRFVHLHMGQKAAPSTTDSITQAARHGIA